MVPRLISLIARVRNPLTPILFARPSKAQEVFESLFDDLNVPMYLLLKEVEYLVPDKHLDERGQVWKLILGQLHYRSVIFFARTGPPSRTEWNRFSSFMAFGLNLLTLIRTIETSTTMSPPVQTMLRRRSSWLGGRVQTTSSPTVAVTTVDPSIPTLTTVTRFLAALNSATDEIMTNIGYLDAVLSRPTEFTIALNQLRSTIVSRFTGLLAVVSTTKGAPLCVSGTIRSHLMRIPARLGSITDPTGWPSAKIDIETSVRALRSELIEACQFVNKV